MSTDEGGILQGWNGIKENVDTLLIRMDEVIYMYIWNFYTELDIYPLGFEWFTHQVQTYPH